MQNEDGHFPYLIALDPNYDPRTDGSHYMVVLLPCQRVVLRTDSIEHAMLYVHSEEFDAAVTQARSDFGF